MPNSSSGVKNGADDAGDVSGAAPESPRAYFLLWNMGLVQF